MPETAARHISWPQHKRQRSRFTGSGSRFTKKHGNILLTLVETTPSFFQGRTLDPWTSRGDSQSEITGAPSGKLTRGVIFVVIDATGQRIIEGKRIRAWEADESSAFEEPMESVELERQIGNQDPDIATEDVSPLTSVQLTSNILDAQAESDMPRLREMILRAEDTDFTVDQSSQLSPWLLSFAERKRNSSDPQDEAAVWSAIRTGASMLTPDAAEDLRPLLEPGHSIETSLVAVKMLGRIFEAQPPTDLDRHKALAGEVCQIAEALLNRYTITVSQSAAMAHLAIYALAAMGSSETDRIIKIIKDLGATWFTRRTYRKLSELRKIWSRRSAAVSSKPRALLDRVVKSLGES